MSFEESNRNSDAVLRALSELTAGATLLKCGRSGKPHFRRFRLTPDLTRLTWESSKRTDAAVLVTQITELKLGQKTAVFKKNPLPECESRSFSLLYSGRSLDIVCTDKKLYDIWTTGLQALVGGFSDMRSLEEYVSLQGKRQSGKADSKITVALGTLRTKVTVSENACDLYTWGSGGRGMLGHKDEDSERLPRVVESLLGRDIVMIACGISFTMALTVTGEVFSWGSGMYGRLGHGNLRDRFSPLMVGAPLRGMAVTFIACHEVHSAAVCDNGELVTWGKAGPHLGYELPSNVTKQLRPRRVDSLSEHHVTQVACGVGHTLACTESNKVFSFGSNKFGELGLGHLDPSYHPQEITTVTGIYKVACGRHHSAAVDLDGDLFMWGWGSRGQLGQGDTRNLLKPTLVEALKQQHDLGVTDVGCGDAHNCVLTSNGIVHSWGDNSAGQLGIAHSYSEITKPRQVLTPTGHQIVQIACGANFSAALSNLGRVFTWGLGSSGQLAHNDTKGRSQPVEVEALSDKQVRMVACGEQHMACTVVHGWVPDEEAKDCMACRRGFTPVRRRHHCRKCGGVYCGSCSTKRFPLLDRGYSDPVRVCDKCYSEVTRDH